MGGGGRDGGRGGGWRCRGQLQTHWICTQSEAFTLIYSRVYRPSICNWNYVFSQEFHTTHNNSGSLGLWDVLRILPLLPLGGSVCVRRGEEATVNWLARFVWISIFLAHSKVQTSVSRTVSVSPSHSSSSYAFLISKLTLQFCLSIVRFHFRR